MHKYHTPETFNEESYKRTGWHVVLKQLDFDNGDLRLIVRVATGRKYWPLFSQIVEPRLGEKDKALQYIKLSIKSYTFPMIDRFVSELETMLSDLYKTEISFKNIDYPDADIKTNI